MKNNQYYQSSKSVTEAINNLRIELISLNTTISVLKERLDDIEQKSNNEHVQDLKDFYNNELTEYLHRVIKEAEIALTILSKHSENL